MFCYLYKMETTLTKLNMKESLQKGEIVNDSQKIISNLTKENESLKKYNGILKDTIRNLKLEMDKVIEITYREEDIERSG
jgi:DNA polymerase III psi subunit